MHGPKYSLLLPVRNEARRVPAVAAAIRADLDACPDPGDWEVVFGDDASDDGTREALRGLAAAHGFRLLEPAANLGRGAMRNLLAREARGGQLVFLDGDCLPLPGFFRAWSGDLDAEAAWLGRMDYERTPPSGLSRFLGEGSGAAKLRGGDALPPAYFVSQCCRIRKDLFLSLGGFRTDLAGWGGEDTDLGYRLAARGVPLRLNRAARARHPSVTEVGRYLDQVGRFGRSNLPVLVRDHPRTARQFKLHLARAPWSWLFLNPLAYRLGRLLAEGEGTRSLPWPHALYRYVLFNCYARGYLATMGAPRDASPPARIAKEAVS